MKTSSTGRALITAREGCKLKAYRDSKGIPTIGVGHVDMTPPKTVMGMVITRQRADELLVADLGQVEAVINKSVKIPMTQNEFDAMASLGFNIGVGGLKRSSVIRLLNLGDVKGAANAFLMWSKPAVLMGRRKAERLQFLKPDERVSVTTLASERATVLSMKATAAKSQAASAKNTGGGVAAAAVIAAPAIAVASHHWAWGFGLGGVALAAAAGAVLYGVSRARKAGVLAFNAGAHADIATGGNGFGSDLVDELAH